MRKWLVILLAVSAIILASGMVYAGEMCSGTKNVTTPGTAVALESTRIYGRSIIVKADLANSGNIYIGDEDVLASAFTGVALDAGEVWIMDAQYMNQIYIDATVGTEGVSFTYRK